MCVVYNVIAFFVFCFLTSFTSILNLITSCFCSSRFHFTSFFHFLFVWTFIFLISIFLNNNFTFLLYQKKKTLQLLPFSMHALPLNVPLLIDFSSVVSFFLFVFPRFYHICFPFPSFVFSVHNLSQRQVCGTVAKKKKNVFVYLPFCCGIFHIYLSLHFLFFRFFCFILMCFWTFFFLGSRSWMSFPLSLPFFMYLFFWRPCLVWSSFFFPFFLLLHTLLIDKNVKWRFPKRVDRLRGRYQSQCASRGHGWHGDEAKRSKQTWQNVKGKTKMNLELYPSLSSL